jgi:signal transduction histidine kinase/ActR/RegA family two-component response regulator
VDFFNLSVYKILKSEQSIVDRARIHLLYYGFLLAILSISALFVNVYLQGLHVIMFTTGCLLVSVIALFKYFTYRPNWLPISHMLLAMGTLLNVAIVFVVLQEVNIITIQITFLIIIFSFYMLGQNWGMFYSLLNLLPIMLFMVLRYYHEYHIDFKPEQADQSTSIIAVFANFTLIILIHRHFYRAFLKNIKQLKKTGEEQAALNVKFEKAIQKAEKSSQVQSEFLSTMSHEIRTPLNAVIGMTDLLLMNNPRPDQDENLEILKFSANNLLAIVNDVLDFNKIESGKVEFEKIKFNLPDLMHSICGGQIIKAENKGLVFNLNIDSSLQNKIILGDPTRLTQVIFNLVSNAIKFTAKGNVWVNAACLEERHNHVTIGFSVKDSGIGIRKENLKSIFEPFTQESITTTRKYGGTGLGLAIVKRLFELQGLQMHVRSKVNDGTEFSFIMDFPVAAEKAVVQKPRVPELRSKKLILPEVVEYPQSGLRVLIAEDNPVNVMLMKKLLSKWKIVPTIAENGERAVETLRTSNFDIVLMDLQMPVMNGFDATKEIRKMHDPAKGNVPIIALTASALFDIKDEVFDAGMNDYVAKPFKADELMEKINRLVA